MDKFQYVTVDNILAKYNRDFRNLDISETDAIEWIGEALGFMKIASASEEGIAFMEVKNFQAPLPNGLHYIIQVAQNNEWVKQEPKICPSEVAEALSEEELFSDSQDCKDCNNWVAVDCHGIPLFDEEFSYYRTYFDFKGEYYGYNNWKTSNYYKEKWSPIRLANHSFFNTLVCQDPEQSDIYRNEDLYEEYTIVGDELRFSFKEGFVAVAYLKQRVDDSTGYPLVPDDEYARNAITYFLAWKMKQREAYMHREGAYQLSLDAKSNWESYIKKFKNKAKMPSGLDQYQNLAEQSRYLIPRHNRYYGFFGKLGKIENRPFNHPEGRYSTFIGNSYYGR